MSVAVRRYSLTALPVLFLAGLVGLWELAVRVLHVPQYILPAPSAIALRVPETFGLIIRHSIVTITEIYLGFALGVGLGIALAVLMALLPALRSAIYPLVLASQTTPKIAVAPLLIVWFGLGMIPKLIIVALLAFFPVLINAMAGFEGADKQQIELMRSVNASRWSVYRHIRLPAAVPYVFAGLKLALSVSVIGAVIAEWVSASEGLGYLLIYYNSTFNVTDMFVVLLALVVIAYVSFQAIVAIEGLLSWEARIRKSDRRGATVKMPLEGATGSAHL